jgi:hypothetical protein
MAEAAPLQPTGKEAVPLPSDAGVAHLDPPEVVLAELAGNALEANHWRHGHRPQSAH